MLYGLTNYFDTSELMKLVYNPPPLIVGKKINNSNFVRRFCTPLYWSLGWSVHWLECENMGFVCQQTNLTIIAKTKLPGNFRQNYN